MSDLLARICATKREHIATRRAAVSLSTLMRQAKMTAIPRGFAAALNRVVYTRGSALITEIKKASPSVGVIRTDFDPSALAKEYATGGAACLSVLTDGPYFQGDDAFVLQARTAVDLPILRKEFFLDPYQVVESRIIGADAILIILAAVSDSQAVELESAAGEFDLDVLVEVHNEKDLSRAMNLNSRLLGINNRNLMTMRVDITVSERLAALVPVDRVLVAESGLSQPADLARLARVGIRRFLIGESLMRSKNVSKATRALYNGNTKENNSTSA
ncbi:Indole-3-glycerol phosphate synthase [invertebrate metagenome]|uniref:indole-3-glycerol-phosphate synthase n=1 Tax=invertebrate metagenome TaxID=1711999 RepID=A0A484H7G2_9ZZZZ